MAIGRLTQSVLSKPRLLVALFSITLLVICASLYNTGSGSYQWFFFDGSAKADRSSYFREVFLLDSTLSKTSIFTISLSTESAAANSTSSPSSISTLVVREPVTVRPECIKSQNLTVVTAFFNIGRFPKGSFANMRGTNSYVDWLRGFQSLLNPVVFFTDDAEIKAKFESWRSPSRDARLCTVTYLVERDQFWPWRCIENYTVALRSRPYTPSPPCTTNPEYDAATNSKYPATEVAVKLNPFQTEHFAWLDAGIYRNSINDAELNSFYVLDQLPELSAGHVGYLEIYPKPKATVESFILHHVDWMAGGMFYGDAKAMLALTQEFSRYAKLFMGQNLVGADQQILGAMFGGTNNEAMGVGYPNASIQLYQPNPSASADPWFHLAYLSRRKIG